MHGSSQAQQPSNEQLILLCHIRSVSMNAKERHSRRRQGSIDSVRAKQQAKQWSLRNPSEEPVSHTSIPLPAELWCNTGPRERVLWTETVARFSLVAKKHKARFEYTDSLILLCQITMITHPHPNPPLEGEGIFSLPLKGRGFSASSPFKGEVGRGMGWKT